MELAYAVRRSTKRKTLTITVDRSRNVIVHAPSTASDEEIRRIVEAKRQWVYEKVRHGRKYQELPHPPGKELVNGESAYYLGRSYRIELVRSLGDEVEFAQRFLIPASNGRGRKGALRKWYVARAKEKLLPRVAHFAHRLGVRYKRAKIVDSRFRWGSCTASDNVTFSWRLIKAPMFVVDYVVVHELAHLAEPNHTPRFWNIVRAQAPTAERARLWLREHGQMLEVDL